MQTPHAPEPTVARLSSLSDENLLCELHAMVASHRRATAAIVEHLGEVDARRLHVEKGFSSLFGYCLQELHFSEDEACRRIEAARLARRFPAILTLLEAGTLSLTVLGLLKQSLSDDNHAELLAGVTGASVRQAKEWIVARYPQPDVPSTIRKQPERLRAAAAAPLGAPARPTEGTPKHPAPGTPALPASTRVPSSTADLVAVPSAPRARVEPLSSERFLVKFTASRPFRDKLELARDLMRHANPSGELSIVIERAVDLLIVGLKKMRYGEGTRPQAKPRPAKSAHVTRSARREVVKRDGWRCSFVSRDGRRCNAQAFLEFDHEIPKGFGGGSDARNLRLLCRAHNRLAAEQEYGRAHIARAIVQARQLRTPCDFSFGAASGAGGTSSMDAGPVIFTPRGSGGRTGTLPDATLDAPVDSGADVSVVGARDSGTPRDASRPTDPGSKDQSSG